MSDGCRWGPWIDAMRKFPERGDYVQVEKRCMFCPDTKDKHEGFITFANAFGIKMRPAMGNGHMWIIERWRKRLPPEHKKQLPQSRELDNPIVVKELEYEGRS